MDIRERSVHGAADNLDICFVLLVLQAAIGVLSLLGLLVFLRFGHSPGWAGRVRLLALIVPTVTLMIAAGVASRHQIARRAALLFESILVLGGLLRLPISGGQGASLMWLVTTLVLPAVVILELTRAQTRAAFHSRSRGSQTTVNTSAAEPDEGHERAPAHSSR